MIIDILLSILLFTVNQLVGIAIRVIVGLTLYASAKHNRFNGAILWGIFGFFFPLLSTIIFYIVYKNSKTKQLYCTVNEPCFKKAMKR